MELFKLLKKKPACQAEYRQNQGDSKLPVDGDIENLPVKPQINCP
jgi:hypothetical protein